MCGQTFDCNGASEDHQRIRWHDGLSTSIYLCWRHSLCEEHKNEVKLIQAWNNFHCLAFCVCMNFHCFLIKFVRSIRIARTTDNTRKSNSVNIQQDINENIICVCFFVCIVLYRWRCLGLVVDVASSTFKESLTTQIKLIKKVTAGNLMFNFFRRCDYY